jgi:tyrosyl-DNA phosphodiesterase-1
MTQAVWRSPLLPLRPSKNADNISIKSEVTSHPIGSGERFKVDFLRYLKAYGKRIASLTTQLLDYDFSAIRAAFIGSAPSRQKPIAAKPSDQTSFGWLGLQEILSTIPIEPTINKTALPFHIVIQVSSIATLGASPTWLMHFQSVLSRSSTNAAPSKNPQSTFFSKSSSTPPQPKHSIVFPVPSEIRTSLDGYASGASIHTKLQSAQQQKQLEYMRPLLCHWKPSSHDIPRRGGAQRGPAAPHIKTYIRFHDTAYNRIDWALLTSANLSKQAWGDVVSKKDEVWIQSWEAGVVVWPDLYGEDVAMVPVFGRDVPEEEDTEAKGDGREGEEGKKTVVGFRMPYDLPLNPYEVGERPWCATVRYEEPDWKGLAWGGY